MFDFVGKKFQSSFTVFQYFKHALYSKCTKTKQKFLRTIESQFQIAGEGNCQQNVFMDNIEAKDGMGEMPHYHWLVESKHWTFGQSEPY